jgi:hypothetical protein
MPKIETEEQFLDLAEKFQKDYCLLRNHVVNTQFVDLSDDLREKAHALYKEAQQIYGYISSSRQLGKYYYLASLSYFACPTTSNTQELSSERYLILQASFLTYRQYQEFAKIDKAENKQKHVCDLFRYVSRYVLDSNHAELFQECSELLNRYVMYERNLKKEDRNQLFNIKDFKQVQAIEYLSALLIIFKRLDDRRVVHRQRKSKKSKVLQWPTKNGWCFKKYAKKKQVEF